MNNSKGPRTGSPDSWSHGEQLAPQGASEAADGLPKANAKKPEAFPQPSAEAERAMRDALMSCYNG